MSRPRGKRIQRELFLYARELLEPYGCALELNFSKRGGHQQMIVNHPRLMKSVSIEIVSTPRDDGQAMQNMRQRCQRLVRDYRLA